jgi:hypothetical protein
MNHEYVEAAKDYAALSGRDYMEVVEAILKGDGQLICTVQSFVEARRSNWGAFDPLPSPPIKPRGKN